MLSTLFLTFANSPEHPLDSLNAEDNALYHALSPRALQLHYMIHRDSHATRESIARDLMLFRDYVTIFHFSGHAGRDVLLTGGGEAQATGIAYLLAQCKQLKLVVLNGCSTEGQVWTLLNNGIPAVIATSAPVNDSKASVFSTRLYEGLAQGLTLAKSFDFAKGEVLMQDKNLPFRDTLGTGSSELASDMPCWGIFCHADRKGVLDEKLPAQTLVPKPQDYLPNIRLENAIWEALKQNSPTIELLVKSREELGDEISRSEIRMQILNNLPAPIAEHLRKLLVPVFEENEGIGYDDISEHRVRQIARTYEFTLRLLAYTLLAQLWEALLNSDPAHPENSPNLPPEDREFLLRFLRMTAPLQARFDYLELIRTTCRLLDNNGVAYFVKELPKLRLLLEKHEGFRGAVVFLEYLRAKLRDTGIHPFEVVEYCIRGEECLADFFRELGFLARYVLTSVQNIDVAKFRHEREAAFVHQVVLLRNLLGKLDRSEQRLTRFLDNRSVLLRRIGKNAEGFLNLSPFVVDENAFEDKTDVAKIFFYNHYDAGANAYTYCFVNKPEDQIRVPETTKRIGILKIQLDAFLRLFLPESSLTVP